MLLFCYLEAEILKAEPIITYLPPKELQQMRVGRITCKKWCFLPSLGQRGRWFNKCSHLENWIHLSKDQRRLTNEGWSTSAHQKPH